LLLRLFRADLHFNQAHLEAESLINDHPMNLTDPELLEDKEKLPHNRFLFSDKKALELSLRMLFTTLSLENNQKAEKAKTR
jgi:hypothetical protein